MHVGAACAALAPEIEGRTGNTLGKNPLPSVRPQAHGREGGREGGPAWGREVLPLPPGTSESRREAEMSEEGVVDRFMVYRSFEPLCCSPDTYII